MSQEFGSYFIDGEVERADLMLRTRQPAFDRPVQEVVFVCET
jgi:hypothetical protein